MRGRSQGVVAVLMAYAIMLILISPVVPSLLTTAPVKHTIQPPNVVLHFAAIVWATATSDAELMREVALTLPAHPAASDFDIVDVTTARLC